MLEAFIGFLGVMKQNIGLYGVPVHQRFLEQDKETCALSGKILATIGWSEIPNFSFGDFLAMEAKVD